jgi:hypothetical protein
MDEHASWYLYYRFRRPIDLKMLNRDLKRQLLAFRDGGSHHKTILNVGDNFKLEIHPAPRARGYGRKARRRVRNAAFLQGLQELGWTVGQNVRVEYRWGASNFDPERMRKGAVAGCACARCGLSHDGTDCAGAAAGEPERSHRLRGRDSSGWCGPGRQPRAAGRQRHRLYYVRISAKWLELLKEISPVA